MSNKGHGKTQPARVIEPAIRVSELDAFFHDLRAAVIELEEAYRNATLKDLLEKIDFETRIGTALTNIYRNLLRYPVLDDPSGRRQQTVYSLLAQMRDELFEIDHWFHAEVVTPPVESPEFDPELESSVVDAANEPTTESAVRSEEPSSTIGPKFLYRVTDNVPQPVVLRYDQLLSARSWRIGFTFANQAAIDELAARMAKQAVQHLARDLHDLGKMLPRLLRNKHVDFPPLVPPRQGRDLEQLIADIVNEHHHHASLSRLSEDYSQKTDLRVKYQDLDRNRGARVQVTMGASRESHESKVKGIKRADHYVLVSPWTLANAVPHFSPEDDQEQPTVQFDDKLITRFWSAIQSQPSDIESLSLALRKIFESAIKKSHLDPRGPMAFVPEAIREFIRVYVESEAFRSTKALRQWLDESGSITRRSDGRLSAYPHPSHETKQAVNEFYQEHAAGSVLRGTVVSVGANEARVQLSEKLRGRVSKFEISWRSAKADPSHFLTVSQEADFLVIQPHEHSNPRLVELSLKRLRPDPWADGSLGSFRVGEIYLGRVQQQKNYGVFVELTPDFVGLLHKTQLSEIDQAKLPALYQNQQNISVRILAIEPERRSISLAPAV